MKAKKLWIFAMAICLASGVRAQFYDSADEICYYVSYKWEGYGRSGEYSTANQMVYVFNFDGKKAAELNDAGGMGCNASFIKNDLKKNPYYYEEKVEEADYNWQFVSSSSKGVVYKSPRESIYGTYIYTFSLDKKFLVMEEIAPMGNHNKYYYKRVDKSFFKVGRSRTPSSGMYE